MLPLARLLGASVAQAGTKIEIGTLDITYFRSAECQIHDTMEFTPGRKPNTRAAVASIVLVPLALLIVGVILYSKYTKQVGTGVPGQGARTGGVCEHGMGAGRSG